MAAAMLTRLLLIGLWSATGLGAALAALMLIAWARAATDARAPAAFPAADAIAILSASLADDGALDPFTRARVETGLALWKAGRAPALVVSGGPHDLTGRNVAVEMANALAAAGVPARKIFIEPRAVSTFENARFVTRIARDKGWRSLIVVTDDYHLARAGALFWWWRPADGAPRVVALAPAPGLARVPPAKATLAVLREVLAYPFNLLKVAGQALLSAVGAGDDRTIR